jgi:3-phenylpropionate/trans-cinnamate dioxygenase ferredoxin reductase component
VSDDRMFVIVGGGLTGATAAEALRVAGFEGRVVLIGAETHRPYERPPLSKGYLIGKEPIDKAYVHSESFYAEHGIELRLGSPVRAIAREKHQLELDGGELVRYDKLLIATGASPVRLALPGDQLKGVHYLRSIEDSTSLREALSAGGAVVIVGGGWIGLEVAAAARGYGCPVTLLERQRAPLLAALGPQLGEFFAQVHREHGVDLRFGVGIDELTGDDSLSGVIAADGRVIPATTAVIGAGVKPNVELAEAAGLLVEDGIVTDEYLCTTDPDIYAAGDVANGHNPFYGRQLRVEHWANAREQGPVAARNMLGLAEAYAKVPYFFSDQYDIGMEFSGLLRQGDDYEVVYRGDLASGEFCVFWLREGIVAAGMNVNVWDVHSEIRHLITSGERVDPQRLADAARSIGDAALA